MRIAVCDDNRGFLQAIRKQLDELPMVEHVSLFDHQSTLLRAAAQGSRFDVVLLDIELNCEENGIDVAEELYRQSPGTKIIYVTGYNDRFSQHIFLRKSNLSGYLTKPVDGALLLANLQKAADAAEPAREPTLMLRVGGTMTAVPCGEILFIESLDHVIQVHTAGETITAYDTLRSVLPTLPAGFFQCHKSFIVNMRQIRRFQAADILLKSGALVPVSRSRCAQTRDAYFQFMKNLF